MPYKYNPFTGIHDIIVDLTSLQKDFETPIGTINSSNRAFTVTLEPIAVGLNGILYRNGKGYDLTGSGPYTVTFDTALTPQTGSDIFSIPLNSAALLNLQKGITYDTVANAAARLAGSYSQLTFIKQSDQPNILYLLVGSDSSIEDSWFGFPYTTDGELIGPIIPRVATRAAMDLIVLENGELAVDSTEEAIRFGNGSTAGGYTGVAMPYVLEVTADTGTESTFDISQTALSKYPGRMIKLIINATNSSKIDSSILIKIGSNTSSGVYDILHDGYHTLSININCGSQVYSGGQTVYLGASSGDISNTLQLEDSPKWLNMGGGSSLPAGYGAYVLLEPTENFLFRRVAEFNTSVGEQ